MRSTLLVVSLLVLPLSARAQEAEHSHSHGSEPMPSPAPPEPPPPAEHAGAHEHGGMAHEHTASPEQMSVHDIPMTRNASGTAWQPDASPHAGLHWSAAGWDFMFHGLLFGGYDWQGGDRGDDAPVGIGWLMLMAEREANQGSFGARVMLSPEAFTAQHNGGYPLLLQTGETWQDAPLHDRQHPHDLFMELAATYTQALSKDWGLQLYVAPAGEPALGPVAFPHRLSASSDPLAVLGHHWEDSTHISFGVLTAGILTPMAKLEGSWFNGREPDENRKDFDFRKLDSYSLRLSVNPTREVSAQLSYGYLPSPETLRPDEPLHRLTASVMVHHPLASGGHWASSAVFGRNVEGDHPGSSAYLLESNLDLDGLNVVFGRIEYVQKKGHDLVLDEALEEETFGVGALALGYLRNFGPLGPVLPGVGVRGAVNFVPAGLESTYGSRTPVGGIIYLRLASAPMGHEGHEGSHP